MQSKTIDKDHAMPGEWGGEGYLINELFLTVQGEGFNAGEAMVFVRFSRCNLRCSKANAGFDCDTDFQGWRALELDELLEEITTAANGCDWILFTGGEPGLQLDEDLVKACHDRGFKVAIETNGTCRLPDGIDWISCSPKSAEHTIRQRKVDEVRIVRSEGQSVPDPEDLPFKGDPIYYLSPAFQPDGTLRAVDAQWCVNAVLASEGAWRLSLQTHKFLGVR